LASTQCAGFYQRSFEKEAGAEGQILQAQWRARVRDPEENEVPLDFAAIESIDTHKGELMNMSFNGARSSRPALPHEPTRDSDPQEPVPKPPGRTLARTREPIPPFSDFVEARCGECEGTGFDAGSHKDFDPEYCPLCGGSGTELVFRNYLAEAFRIVSDPHCKVELCREQIVALATYARQTVSALFGDEATSTREAVNQNDGGPVTW
jgi:hypothetical protein